MGDALSVQILGPLRLRRGDAELDAGPRQQAYLLGLLVAQVGRPVGTGELIDLIWGEDAPASALNVIQKYVGALRRVLEPDLPAREAGSYLLRHGNGYVFVAGADTLDLVSFRELADATADGPRDEALARYLEALKLWQGAAGAGFAPGPAAMPVFAALHDEFFDVCLAAARLAVELGRPERVLAPLRLAAGLAPLHEPVQACLVGVLGAAGQQAEALSVFGAVRARLADELGIDPGPALQDAYRQVLGPAGPLAPVDRPRAEAPAGMVGRVEELAALRQAIGPALTGGTGLALVEGEPGVGKTRLLEEIAAEARQRGALVVWGRCLQGDGAPSMWPWVEIVGVLLDALPAAARAGWLDGELNRLVEPLGGSAAPATLPDRAARFRMFERVVGLIGHLSRRRPVVLVIDDLQWADVASLHLVSHLAVRLPGGAAVVGALRDRAPLPGSDLSRMLAIAGRVPGHRRVRLGPLSLDEVTALVRLEIGAAPGSGTARTIHERTAGNPFFVRELSRLLAGVGAFTEDAAQQAGVPSAVRDVVDDRIADLDPDTRDLLQVAAIIGRDVGVELLARAAGVAAQTVLDLLEPLTARGLVGHRPDDPYAIRFAHDLVRESVASSTPRSVTARLHLRVADALQGALADDAESLAHHLWAAGPLADPARTTQALVRAARRAANMAAFEAANRQLELAVQLARSAGLEALELSALSLLAIVVRRMAQYSGSAFEVLERAEDLARRLGRDAQAADFLYIRWIASAHAAKEHRDQLVHQLRDQGKASTDPLVRAYGRQAWGLRQWELGDIGESFRHMGTDNLALFDATGGEEDAHRGDVQLPWPCLRAMVTALHGDVESARAQLDAVESGAREDPYMTSVWAYYTGIVAAMAGDPALGRRAVEGWLAADPERFFVHVDPYLRQTSCWLRAMTGDDPAAAAAEAEELLNETLLEPPRWGLAFYCGLIAEMHLAAGNPAAAAVTLDRADGFLEAHGQRYAVGLLLLLRARTLAAGGEPVRVVRAAADRARRLSTERGAHLFARRAIDFLATL